MKTKDVHYQSNGFWELLTERGITFRSFAHMVGYHESSIYQFRSGALPLTRKFVLLASAIVGVDADDFFVRSDVPNGNHERQNGRPAEIAAD